MRTTASPWLQQFWTASAAREWNRTYQQTSERALLQGVPRMSVNGVAARHADYLTGRSQYPAPAIPYVTVGPGAIRR